VDIAQRAEVIHNRAVTTAGGEAICLAFTCPHDTADRGKAQTRTKGSTMSSLKVTPGQLQSMSGSVARTTGEVRAQQQSLKSQLAPLFGADWAGAAAAQFTALYQQFDQHATGLSNALDGIGQLLGRAGLAYAEVEEQIAASFR
jgi:WXG100 family type VII secretion target